MLREQLLAKDAFEHFILTEIIAHSSYSELDYSINYWRTKSGLEVDFVLGSGEVAVEVKGTGSVNNRDLRAIKAFYDEYKPKKTFIICNEKEERVIEKIRVLSWRRFLDSLWEGSIIG